MLAARLPVFLAVLAIMSLAEALAPRRTQVDRTVSRRLSNAVLLAVGATILRLVPVLSAAGAATWAEAHRIGLLALVDWPLWAELVVTVALFDLLIYAQHVALHRTPLLWRVHKVHHADSDLDATSALRFHPGEILLSAAIKSAAAVALGAPASGVVLFEIVLNAAAIFNHANLAIPPRVDRWLRLAVVTPDMHRVHHSVRRAETDSNFGFSFPWWDRIFGTYRAQPEGGHESLELGLADARRPESNRDLRVLLGMPFRSAKTAARRDTPKRTGGGR
ncbi:sterol desaturase family protein [Botrimarina sp.]|uniref:sterol desaturase family protein n=1 Tax=Botrimarina sp. TaxID=2795802 RepID=UPI0032EE0F09